MIDTDETLLDRVRRTDAHEAWREFYTAYRAPVLGYAHRFGLRGKAAEEVLQDTFVALVKLLPGFRYDRERGRFRHFLLRIVHHRAQAALKRTRRANARQVSPDNFDGIEMFADETATEFGGEEWARALENWRASLAAEAIARVRRHPAMRDGTFAVFESCVLRGQTAADAAAAFGITSNNVHQICHRTMKRVRHELADLLRSAGESPK